MPAARAYQVLADAVLALHTGLAIFVVGALLLIVGGNLAGWRWVNGLKFRLVHLAAIAVIAAESWLGLVCPLTTLEMWLRAKGHGASYGGGFIEHWLQHLLYCDAPPWVFTTAYTLFALAVAVAWRSFPPRRPGVDGKSPVRTTRESERTIDAFVGDDAAARGCAVPRPDGRAPGRAQRRTGAG